MPIFIEKFSDDLIEGLKTKVLFWFKVAVDTPHQLTLKNKTICEGNFFRIGILKNPVNLLVSRIIINGMNNNDSSSIGELGANGVI